MPCLSDRGMGTGERGGGSEGEIVSGLWTFRVICQKSNSKVSVCTDQNFGGGCTMTQSCNPQVRRGSVNQLVIEAS